MAVGGNEVEISELFVKPVPAKEYKDSSRILSKSICILQCDFSQLIFKYFFSDLDKEKYDKFKTKQEKDRQEEEDRKQMEKRSKKKRKHSRSRSRSKDRSDRSEKKKSSKSKRRSEEREIKREGWLYPHLRVRCIDSHFKDGQYYKQKVRRTT